MKRDDTLKDGEMLRVSVYDGKYTVVQGPRGGVRALRYGEEWRDCLGDGLILALAQEVESCRTLLKECAETFERYAHNHEQKVTSLNVDTEAVKIIKYTDKASANRAMAKKCRDAL